MRAAIAAHFPEISADAHADLGLVVSELVANAVLHGRGEITLRLQFDDGILRGEVIDQGGGFERQLRERGPEDVGGRGLLVVEALCASWGVHEGTTHVWFELDTRGSQRAHPTRGSGPRNVRMSSIRRRDQPCDRSLIAQLCRSLIPAARSRPRAVDVGAALLVELER